MIDVPVLASMALGYLLSYLGDTAKVAADASKQVIGKKIAAWLEEKLAGKPEAAALEKLKQEPSSVTRRDYAKSALTVLLESDPGLRAELEKLLAEVGAAGPSIRQTATAGDGAKIIQVAGNNNSNTIG